MSSSFTFSLLLYVLWFKIISSDFLTHVLLGVLHATLSSVSMEQLSVLKYLCVAIQSLLKLTISVTHIFFPASQKIRETNKSIIEKNQNTHTHKTTTTNK